MSDLEALIAELGAVEEGSPELDEDIALAAGIWRAWLSKHRYWNFDGPGERHFSWPQDGIPDYSSETGRKIVLSDEPWHGWCWDADLPEFSTSIDAALPIEKEGWWDISGPRCYLNIPTPSPNYWKATLTLWEPMCEFVGWGATEALARRIAALKAQLSRGLFSSSEAKDG